MKWTKRVVVVLLVMLICMLIRNAVVFDVILYDSVSEFEQHTYFFIEDRDYAEMVEYELNFQVNTVDEAVKASTQFIQENYSFAERSLSNIIIVPYDTTNNGFIMYYKGFLFIHDTFCFISLGSSTLYYIIPI